MSVIGVEANPIRADQPAHRRWLLIGVCAALMAIFCTLVAFTFLFQQYYADRIYPDVMIEGFNVGGMTQDQVAGMIQKTYERTLVVFDTGTNKWYAPWSSVGITVNANEAATQAFAIGRTGSIDQRIRDWQARKPVHVTFGYDEAMARSFLEQHAAEVYIAPSDAGVTLTYGLARMIPSVQGRELDVEATLQGFFAAALKEQPILVHTRPVEATLTDTSRTIQQLNTWLDQPLTLTMWWDNAFITRTVAPEERMGWVSVAKQEDGYAASLVITGIHESLARINAELGPEADMRLDEATGMVHWALMQCAEQVWFVVPHRELVHVVKRGDTFESLGDYYGIPVSRIIDANPSLWQEGGFSIGQPITIPAQNIMLPVPISPTNQQRIEVNLSTQVLSAYDAGRLVLTTSISSGIPKWRTLVGVFQVQEKVDNAYNKLAHIYMPNWLSIYDIGDPGNSLTNGIHALPVLGGGRRLWAGYLGHPVSFGCIVVGIEDSEKLYQWAQLGTPVLIYGTTPPSSLTYDDLIEAQKKTENNTP